MAPFFAAIDMGIGLSLFEPEKSSFAVTKTLQIGCPSWPS
jgi:hypothetical protein